MNLVFGFITTIEIYLLTGIQRRNFCQLAVFKATTLILPLHFRECWTCLQTVA